MCTITVQDVKDFTGSACAPDSIIQLYINSISSKIGVCLDTYDEATCQLIFLNMVGHLTCGKTGKIASENAPNGASTSYQLSKTKTGLASSFYGEQVLALDTRGCAQSYFANAFMLDVIGQEHNANFYVDGGLNDFGGY